MAVMRAKMYVASVMKDVSRGEGGSETLTMYPVAGTFDKDGNSEDNTFARWSPSGKFEMTITNPNLFGKFKAGEKYYLDFTKAES